MDSIESRSSYDHQQPQDRLSSLPNALLLHIFSFLPTKHAVRTGALSNHWLRLWTSLTVLDFHDPSDPLKDKEAVPLLNFINRILILHNAPKIQKLTIRLLYHWRYNFNFDLWLRPSLKFLELCYCKDFDSLEINSPTVRELVIDGYAMSGGTLDISVPYVQSLHILGIMKKSVLWTDGFGSPGYEESLVLKEILGQLSHVRDLTLGKHCIQE